MLHPRASGNGTQGLAHDEDIMKLEKKSQFSINKEEKNKSKKPVLLKPNLLPSMTSLPLYQRSDPSWHAINKTIDSPPQHFLPNLLCKCNNIV